MRRRHLGTPVAVRDNGPTGWCWNSEDHVKNVTLYLMSSGLAKLGYNHINVDEGWLLGRYPNGTIYEDLSKFPSGMKGLGDWITSQELYPGASQYFEYGLYSCRGTCQCSTGSYQGPGSHGYEANDTIWMINAGATYLKVGFGGLGAVRNCLCLVDTLSPADAVQTNGPPPSLDPCLSLAFSMGADR